MHVHAMPCVQATTPCFQARLADNYTYYGSQARLAAEDAQPWYNSEAQKPQPLRQGVGKYIAQSTWEQSHAPAPRWGGGGGGGSSGGDGGGASARALEAAEEMAGELRPAKKTKREAKSFGDFSGW